MMGLQAVKDYLVDILEKIENDFQKMETTNANQIAKIKTAYLNNREKREQSDRLRQDIQLKLKRLVDQRTDKEKKQKEREILDKIDNDRYLEELKQEQ